MMTFYEPQPETNDEIEAFLEDLRSTTGASQLFIDAARPAVERVFSSTPEKSRHEAILSIRRTVELQAATETSVLDAIARARSNETDSPSRSKEIRETELKLQLTRATVVSSILNSYGGFGAYASVDG